MFCSQFDTNMAPIPLTNLVEVIKNVLQSHFLLILSSVDYNHHLPSLTLSD